MAVLIPSQFARMRKIDVGTTLDLEPVRVVRSKRRRGRLSELMRHYKPEHRHGNGISANRSAGTLVEHFHGSLSYTPDRGDLVHVNLSPSAGRGLTGPHYALILSPGLQSRRGRGDLRCDHVADSRRTI